MNKFSQKNKSLLKNKKSKKNIKKIYRQTKINKIIGGSNTIVSVNSNFNDQNVKKIIEFIKKNMLYKNKNNSNTNNSLFDTYTNDKYIQKNYGFNSFEKLIEDNYKHGYNANSKILKSEKYLIHLHGEIINKTFKLPENINIVFLSSIRYMVCLNFKTLTKNLEKSNYLDAYLKNPFCLNIEELKTIFKYATIYYGGQTCIDLYLGRNDIDFVTGISYLSKNNDNDSYNIGEPYEYNTGEFNEPLSEFISKIGVNKNRDSFDPKLNYTLIFLSCRGTESIGILADDSLVFHENTLKLLNFRINYDYLNKDNHVKNNLINSKYDDCKKNKNSMLNLSNSNTRLAQEFRKNTTKIKARFNTSNMSNMSNITHIKFSNDNIVDLYDLEDIINQLIVIKISNFSEDAFQETCKLLFKKLDFKFGIQDIIYLDFKDKIKIIYILFKRLTNEYNLKYIYITMFELFVYLQININIIIVRDQKSKKIIKHDLKCFVLEFCFNFIKELETELNKDLSMFKSDIDIIILNFMYSKFGQNINTLGIVSFNFHLFNSDSMTLDDEATDNAISVLSFLYNNKILTELNISNTNINDKFAIQLYYKLKNNKTLTTLNISHNEIGADGAIVLVKVLENNTTLTNFDISSNIIGYDGAEALAEALKNNKTLTNLDISSNDISYDGAIVLAKALKNNTTLTNLNISSNEDKSIKNLADLAKLAELEN